MPCDEKWIYWPRDQETELPVDACWLSQTQDCQTEQIHPQNFDDPFFWQHWQDLHALGSHWKVSQQGILCWDFKGVQEEISSEEANRVSGISTRRIHQSTTPSLSQTIWRRRASIPHPPYSSDISPCDFWLFPKPRGCCYETIEEMKVAVTEVIDMLTQDDFHGAFQKLLERYNRYIATGGDYFEGVKIFMRVLSIKVPIRKKVWKLI